VLLAIEGLCFHVRRGETVEVPARIDERVERVGFAPPRPAALRAADVLPGRMAVERIARLFELDVLRQLDRQVLLGHRHQAALFAMDGRDRRAPIALARYQPVAQAVLNGALADTHLLQALDDLDLGVLDGEAIKEI
jgi:hypothetical protein